jgi:hypothetical protein
MSVNGAWILRGSWGWTSDTLRSGSASTRTTTVAFDRTVHCEDK